MTGAEIGAETGAVGFQTIGEWRDDAPLIGALIIPVDGEGRVLLQLRDYNTIRFPGQWGFFGGKVEAGEDLATAARREFQEEAGVTLDPGALTARFRMSSPEVQSNLYIFEASVDLSPADIVLGEGAGFAFVDPEDFARLDLAQITKVVLAEWVQGRSAVCT